MDTCTLKGTRWWTVTITNELMTIAKTAIYFYGLNMHYMIHANYVQDQISKLQRPYKCPTDKTFNLTP